MELIEYKESQFRTYIQKPMISKDIFSIRAKGVWLENVLEFLEKEYQLELKGYYQGKDVSIGYYEHCYIGKNGIKAVFAHARMGGMPSLIIGCNTKKEWIELREVLRKNGFVR